MPDMLGYSQQNGVGSHGLADAHKKLMYSVRREEVWHAAHVVEFGADDGLRLGEIICSVLNGGGWIPPCHGFRHILVDNAAWDVAELPLELVAQMPISAADVHKESPLVISKFCCLVEYRVHRKKREVSRAT